MSIDTSKLPSNEYFEYVGHELNSIIQLKEQKIIDALYNQTINKWILSYNLIKGDNWPICTRYEDFNNLPEWIQTECIVYHNFSPDIWYNQIKSGLTYFDYPNQDQSITRFKHIILDNLEHIEHKRIVDFSSHVGHLSFICAKNNCTSVIATDIRQENIDIINKSILKFSENKIITQLADIHCYDNNTEICKNADTILLCGIMYHVHDHYAILESITSANPSCIIIETTDNLKISNVDEPLICWKTEATENILSGWYKDNESMLVGYPNVAWLDLAANSLGYTRTKSVEYKLDWISNQEETRSVHVFCKNTGFTLLP